VHFLSNPARRCPLNGNWTNPLPLCQRDYRCLITDSNHTDTRLKRREGSGVPIQLQRHESETRRVVCNTEQLMGDVHGVLLDADDGGCGGPWLRWAVLAIRARGWVAGRRRAELVRPRRRLMFSLRWQGNDARTGTIAGRTASHGCGRRGSLEAGKRTEAAYLGRASDI